MKFYLQITILLLVKLNASELVLPAVECFISHEGAQLTSKGVIEHWHTTEAALSWKIKVTRPGKVKVSILQACDENIHGSIYYLQIDQQILFGRVKDSGGWQLYNEINLGEIELKQPGEYTVILQAFYKPKRAVMNFKAIKLTGAALQEASLLKSVKAAKGIIPPRQIDELSYTFAEAHVFYDYICCNCHSDNSRNAPKLDEIKDLNKILKALNHPSKTTKKFPQPMPKFIISNELKKNIAKYIAQLTPQNQLTEAEKKSGWKLLFDGKSFNGWRNFNSQQIRPGWQVHNGTLRHTRNGGDLITIKKYKNFKLKLQWRISNGGNSGIFLRTSETESTPWKSAIEMQVLDNSKHPNGNSPMTSAGAIYGLYPAPEKASRQLSEWQDVHIIVNGNRYTFFLNDVKIAGFSTKSEDWQRRVENSKFRLMPSFAQFNEGHIGLQDHGDLVWYRNIKILELN